MVVGLYGSKDELLHAIGQPLHYQDDGVTVCGYARFGTFAVEGPPGRDGERWTAEVSLINGRIVRVE
jgi:hypothetical protein